MLEGKRIDYFRVPEVVVARWRGCGVDNTKDSQT
jgi:hypothetical protein